ncbi:MAG: threonine/serine dehydratase [Planctomycetaceae bacterium]|nr:threonine/serine dehydratase [Planctomycetaceae bacterium]
MNRESPASDFCVGPAEILAAVNRIAGHVLETPLIAVPVLSADAGCDIWLKCENLQYGAAFKSRGACNAVFALSDAEARSGVVTHSSGNHAAALAHAARLRGIRAHIVMPENSAPIKLNAVRALGVEPILCGSSTCDREEACVRVQRHTGATLIHPYDNPEVIAGQASIAIEILRQLPTVEVIVVLVGGGGLLAGTLLAVRMLVTSGALSSRVRVVAAEPEAADDTIRSLTAGRIQTPSRYDSVADGLRTQVGNMTFPIIQQLVDAVLPVSEAAILEATRDLIWRAKLVAEPSGAVTVGCIRQHSQEFQGKRVVAVISGGNLNPQLLREQLIP